MPVITIDSKNLIQGESQNDWINDRGFSPDSYGLNLLKRRGSLYFLDSGVEVGGGAGRWLAGVVVSVGSGVVVGGPLQTRRISDCLLWQGRTSHIALKIRLRLAMGSLKLRLRFTTVRLRFAMCS